MKKVAAFVALSLLMAGCVSNDKIAVTPEQLQHHRFVLESVNGKPVTSDKNPPEISFGEKMMISGSMCNRFSGEGKLSNGELGNDSNLLIVFYVQIMPDDFVMQLHRF